MLCIGGPKHGEDITFMGKEVKIQSPNDSTCLVDLSEPLHTISVDTHYYECERICLGNGEVKEIYVYQGIE